MNDKNPFPIEELRQVKPKFTKGLDITKGTLECRALPNFPWRGNKLNILMNVCDDRTLGNNIAIFLNDKNKLVASYSCVNPKKAFCKFEVDLGDANPKAPHHIAVTWDLNAEELKLYFDGKCVKEGKIR